MKIPSILHRDLVMACDAKRSASYTGGNIWYDMSGMGNDLTRNSSNISYNSNGYFSFSSAVDGNIFSASTCVVQRSGSFSITVVYRRNSTSNPFQNAEQIFANTGSADGFRCGFSSGSSIYYLIGGAGGTGFQEGTISAPSIGDGSWRSITWVFDRAAILGSYTIYAYVNGALAGSNAISAGASGNINFQSNFAAMGYNYCCRQLKGDFAAIYAYNTALSAAEVQYNYFCLKQVHGLV